MSDIISRLNIALTDRYRIERRLGEGGMATVYLADDIRHQRKVALKVLKPELAAVVGAERFLAEIKTTANLHHPHVLPLFDSGEADGFLFYVMPSLEGETLRDWLDREGQLPVDEAVAIAIAVAQALQHAHDRKVIHRDIKPGNILVQDGQPVVSDFGIALAAGSAGGARLTETGLSIGTPFYMSPEQATGDMFVGPATDIWALGCVLYEMLIGSPPHIGSTPQAVLGKVIQGAPVSAAATRSSVPAHVDAAIRRALEKLPADRFASAKDFAKALTDPGFRHGVEATTTATAGPWRRVAIASSAVALLAVAVAASVLLSRDSTSPSVVRFTVPVGEDADLYLGGENDASWGRPGARSIALSPDGELLAYAAWQALSAGGFQSRLYLRRLDLERADPVAGTEGASTPFFSPDGEWIAFFAGRSLRRVRVGGGSVETIVAETDTPTETPWGATWGDNGTILYGGGAGLYHVAASGGEPSVVAERPSEAHRYTDPQMLPGSRAALLAAWASLDPDEAEIVAVDLATGASTSLLGDAMHPLFVDTGHLLFVRRGTLMAVGFDPEALELLGEPFLLLADVAHAVGMPNTNFETGAAQVALSPAGHMAYARGGVFPERRGEVVRVGLDGEAKLLFSGQRNYVQVRTSPDASRLVFSFLSGQAQAVAIHDLTRSVTEPLRTGFFRTNWPEWSPDGRSIAFTQHASVDQVYRMPVDGTAEPRAVAPSNVSQTLASWSVDGVLAYLEGDDIWVLPPDGEPAPFFTSAARELYPTFSPDGRWLAYQSNQTGTLEIYVRPYPGPDPATRIPGDGGSSPVWSPDGRRLYFVSLVRAQSGERAMMASEVTLGDDVQAGRPYVLIDPWPYLRTVPLRSHDVLSDGSFVAVRAVDGGIGVALRTLHRVDDVHVVLNFTEELRRRRSPN
jgi:serine/threonine-protein kinase